VRVVLELEGKRYDAVTYGRAARRLRGLLAGEQAVVVAEREALPANRRAREAARHVVGRADVRWVGDTGPGAAAHQLANRVRRAAGRGLADVPADVRPLVLGVALGDDREQSAAMRAAYRAAGLAHLTAVSGQNVAFVLALARPLLLRLALRSRWAVTVTLLAWFALLTRFEPSVCRAVVMAGIAATGDLLGRTTDPRRTLPLAVAVLVLVDPLLVRSYGFWLSVSATAGIVTVGPLLRERLPGRGWLREVLATTIAAQLGVAPVVAVLFGGEPLGSLPANVLAEPAAALVMTWGLPGALAGSVLPDGVSRFLQAPTVGAARWIDLVAVRTASLDVAAIRPYTWLLHIAVAAALVRWARRRPAAAAAGEGGPPRPEGAP
jgi:competence protein ComEC